MRNILAALILVGLFCLPLLAQDNYKAEIFGGYQLTRINPGNGVDGQNYNGWNGSVTANVNGWLGFTGDVSGGYKGIAGVDTNVYNFLFGPTVSYRQSEKLKPFAHVLFGVSRAGAGFGGLSASDSAFAMAFGGGADLGINRNFAVRVAQFDYLMTRFGSDSQNNIRLSTGVVVRF
jgi:hypothetical protein